MRDASFRDAFHYGAPIENAAHTICKCSEYVAIRNIERFGLVNNCVIYNVSKMVLTSDSLGATINIH